MHSSTVPQLKLGYRGSFNQKGDFFLEKKQVVSLSLKKKASIDPTNATVHTSFVCKTKAWWTRGKLLNSRCQKKVIFSCYQAALLKQRNMTNKNDPHKSVRIISLRIRKTSNAPNVDLPHPNLLRSRHWHWWTINQSSQNRWDKERPLRFVVAQQATHWHLQQKSPLKIDTWLRWFISFWDLIFFRCFCC